MMSLEYLAEMILFGPIKTKEQLEESIKGYWQYRKNKGFGDVNKAIKKGLKLGSGKVEREISCVEMYLKDVFKKA
ncbi:hypothetical protein MOD67_13855 [Bacillus licheniformis]|uniref:hypothetical protein n=1 Tax=Bacillus licheniformis TaxID=1402 RepID=UPI002281E811|nr:hypothetical protein [Bacillus licheniformis]MCY8745065.1 hypothetical protein [Bacillus licheniformis]